MTMNESELLLLSANQVKSIVSGQEKELVSLVREAYLLHSQNKSVLPNSVFLTFPDLERERIIGLPAYIGGSFDAAGLKWISSFPENVKQGKERASAVMILNSLKDGRAQAIIDGTYISASRTGASAALAGTTLRRDHANGVVVLIGCGPINLEVVRYLKVLGYPTSTYLVYDLDKDRADAFAKQINAIDSINPCEVCSVMKLALGAGHLISIATSAVTPFITSLDACLPGSVILHVSLRDIIPECLSEVENVVDDAEHVCRANTSIHLLEKLRGNRHHIRCELADILSGDNSAYTNENSVTVFSPFGLGVLDLAWAS